MFLFDSGTLPIVQRAIFSDCTRHRLLGSDYDSVFIYHHVDEFKQRR